MAKVIIEAALDPASVAKLAGDLNNLLGKLNAKALPIRLEGAADINALRAKIENELASMTVKFPNLTKQLTTDVSKAVQDAFIQSINSGAAPKLGDIFKGISNSDAKMAFAQTKTVVDELASAADKTRLAMVEAFANAHVPSSVLAPLLDNINAVDAGWDKAIQKVKEFAATIPQAASSVQGMAKALGVPDTNASQILQFAKENAGKVSESQVAGFLSNQKDPNGQKLFDVQNLDKATGLVKQVSDYMSGISVNAQKQTTALTEEQTKRMSQIKSLESMASAMPEAKRAQYIEELNQNLDATDKDWNNIVESMGRANKEAQALNASGAEIQHIFKGLSEDSAKELARRIQEIAADAKKFGRDMGDSAVKAQIRTAIQDIGSQQGLPQAQIDNMLSGTDKLVGALARASNGTEGFTNAHRRLGSALGLSMNLVTQFGSVLTNIAPQFGLVSNALYSGMSAFTAVGMQLAILSVLFKGFEMAQQRLTQVELLHIQALTNEGLTYEQNKGILEAYYRAKNTGLLGTPIGGYVNTMSLLEAQGIMPPDKLQDYLKQNSMSLETYKKATMQEVATKSFFGDSAGAAALSRKQFTDDEAEQRQLDALLEKRQKLQASIDMGKNANLGTALAYNLVPQLDTAVFGKTEAEVKKLDATIKMLEQTYGKLAGASGNVKDQIKEQATIVTANSQVLHAQDIAALGAAKSQEQLFAAMLKNRGIKPEDAYAALNDWQEALKKGSLLEDPAKIFARDQAVKVQKMSEELFTSQADKAFKENEAQRKELLFYARLVVPPDEYAKLEQDISKARRDIESKPDSKIRLGLEFTQTVENLLAKATKGGQALTLKDQPEMQKLLIGNAPQESLKAMLPNPRDYDELIAQVQKFDAANRNATATVKLQRQELIASFVQQHGLAQATLQPMTEQGQAASKVAVEMQRQAQIAALPLNAQVKMNEEIRKYLTAQGDVATFTQATLTGVDQIKNSYIEQYTAVQAISVAEQQATQAATRRAFVEQAIGDALTMQLQTAIKKAEIDYQAGIQIRETQRSFEVNPATRAGPTGYYEQDRARALWKFNIELNRTETEFEIQRARTRMQFERQWQRDEFLHNQTLAEQATEYHISRKRAEESFQIDMRRSYEAYLYDLDDAAANNDAASMVKIYRRYELEKKAKQEDFAISQQRAEEDFNRQRALDQLHYNQQREWSRMLFEEQQRFAQQDFDRQREYRLIDFKIQEQDAQIARNRQIEQNKFQQQEILHQAQVQAEELRHQNQESLKLKAVDLAMNRQIDSENARQIFEIYDKMYGTGDGSITKIMMEYFEKERDLLKKRDTAIKDTTADIKASIEAQNRDLDAVDKRDAARQARNNANPNSSDNSGGWINSLIDGVKGVFGGLGKVITDANKENADKTATNTAATADVLSDKIAPAASQTANNTIIANDYARQIRDNTVGIAGGLGAGLEWDKAIFDNVTAAAAAANNAWAAAEQAAGIGMTTVDLVVGLYNLIGTMQSTITTNQNNMISMVADSIVGGDAAIQQTFANYMQPTIDLLARIASNTSYFPTTSFNNAGPQADGSMIKANTATVATFGEAGEELAIFIPTNKMQAVGANVGGGGTANINVNVTGDLGGQVSAEFENKLLQTLAKAIVEATPTQFLSGAR